jgi:hypothetical protein
MKSVLDLKVTSLGTVSVVLCEAICMDLVSESETEPEYVEMRASSRGLFAAGTYSSSSEGGPYGHDNYYT